MSNQELYTSCPIKITIEEIKEKEQSLNCTDEVRENVIGFMMLVALGEVIPLGGLTLALLVIFPPMGLLGIILIVFLLNHFFKELQNLNEVSED